MDGHKERELIECLQEKRELLDKMLTMTKRVKFNGDENDSVKYIELMDNRQELMDRIFEIDGEIKRNTGPGAKLLDNFSGDNRLTAAMISDNIKSLAAQILDLDEKNKAAAGRIMDSIKKNMQNLQKNKNLRNMYDDDVSVYNGYFVDKKK